jgi:hypothetical protein
MTRGKLILWSMLVAGTTASASAATEHYAISTDIVAAAIGGIGVAVAPEQVTLLTDVVATKPAPVLKVRSVEKMDNERLVARMECESHDECLPFYVSIRVGQGSKAHGALVLASLSAADLAPRSNAKSIVLRAGSVTTLQLDGDHIQIRLPVICLESGSPGKTVRATDKNHRVVYSALVIDGSLLKGRLQ